jgi:myosin-5
MNLCNLRVSVTDCNKGLQTPRLKRLAEIVSAQAIAQQEKLEYPQDDAHDLTDSELNGA